MGESVEIRLFGVLKALTPADAATLAIGPDATVGALLDRLGIPRGKVHLTFVNEVSVRRDAPLRNGDTLAVFPALGGG